MRIKRMLCACLVLMLTAALAAAPALAKVASPGKEFYFLDEADVLSEATEGEIFFSNQLLEKACGAQIVVVAVKTTGSEAIDDYAYDLFNSWGIGDPKKNNGFLLLLAIDDDKYYALCGTDLQPKFTSGALNDYFDDYLEADFAAKRYDAGVRKFYEAVFARIADTYNANVTVDEGVEAYEAWAAEGSAAMTARSGGGSLEGAKSGYNGNDNRENEDGYTGLGVIIFVALLILLIMLLRRRRRMSYMGGGTRVTPIFFGSPRPPHGPMGPQPGPGGIRGAGPQPPIGAGGVRGNTPSSRPASTGGLFGGSSFGSSSRSSGGLFGSSSSSSRSSSSSSSRSFGGLFGGSSSRSFGGGSSRSFGSSRGLGGGSRGGGAGRGRR